MDHLNVAFWTICVFLVYISSSVESCSCGPAHPQEHFCNADFVILARIKREHVVNGTKEYKIRIRKEYKMSEKSYVALKYGRLLTAADESMCGVKLEVGKIYAISGKVVTLQARVNMCGFYEKWQDLTKRQRKGLKLMYRQGCNCKIKFCPNSVKRCMKSKDACNWDTWRPDKRVDCQRNEGICLRSASKQCIWSKSATLTACARNSTVMHHQPKAKTPQRYNLPFRDGRGRKFGQ